MGEKLLGFRTLLTRCRRIGSIRQDIELVERLLKKAEGKSVPR
jgi:hypothetical protein